MSLFTSLPEIGRVAGEFSPMYFEVLNARSAFSVDEKIHIAAAAIHFAFRVN